MKATYTLMLGDEEFDVDFQIEADISYEPEYISGPPEDCYPASGDCDITEIKVLSQVDGLRDADILDALGKQVGTDKITDDLWSDYHSQGVDDGPA